MLSKDEFIDAIMDLHNTASRYAAEYLAAQPSDAGKPLSGEDIGKIWDLAKGPVAESETQETYITKVTIDSSIRRHSLRLGKRPKVVFCKLSPLGNRLELWIERANDLDLGTITNFDFFREDEVIPSDYHHVFSFKRSLRRVSHFYMRVAD